MKRIKLVHHNISSQVGLLLLIFFICLSNGKAYSQEKKKKKSKPFDVQVGLASFYDNNILKYSQKYLDRFMYNEDFGRFHIDTYDDIIVKPSLSLATTINIFKKQKTKISLYANYNAYVVNPIKNWQYYIFGFQQSFAKNAIFRFSYSYIPDFYVRHFRDEDLVNYYKEVYGFGYIPESFVPFSFSKDDYSFYVQNTFFKSTRIRLIFDYARYYHNEHYTEYDCKNFIYGFRIYQGIGKKVEIDFGYDYGTSDAIGYDQPLEIETWDDADADNLGDAFFLGVNWRLPDLIKRRQYISADVEFNKRYYTTDNYVELDPEHAGRVDNVLELGIDYRYRVSKSFDIDAFFNWFGRDSKTSSPINSFYVSNEKDYKQYQIGLKVSYGFSF